MDSLAAYRRTEVFRQQQQLLVASAPDATRLSQMRYKGGVASYLEALTNDTNYFSASKISHKDADYAGAGWPTDRRSTVAGRPLQQASDGGRRSER